VWFSVIFGFLVDVGGNLILVEFGRILRYRVDVSGIFRLVDPSGFFRFWFRV